MGPRRGSRGRGSTRRDSAHAKKLQWGHGEGAVEEARACALTEHGQRLQWGHGEGAVEERAQRATAPTISTGFNGATAREPWKRPEATQG